MKRDWNIIRDILQTIEDNRVCTRWKELEPEMQEKYLLHYELLQESGMIVNFQICSQLTDDFKTIYYPPMQDQRPFANAMRMTMQGYDLLEALRSPKVWSWIKQRSLQLGEAMSWELIKQSIPLAYKALLS